MSKHNLDLLIEAARLLRRPVRNLPWWWIGNPGQSVEGFFVLLEGCGIFAMGAARKNTFERMRLIWHRSWAMPIGSDRSRTTVIRPSPTLDVWTFPELLQSSERSGGKRNTIAQRSW